MTDRNQNSQNEKKDQTKSNQTTLNKILKGIFVIFAVCFGLYAISVASMTFLTQAIKNSLQNPSDERRQELEENAITLAEESEARVRQNFTFDSQITQSEFLPNSEDVLLVSFSDYINSDIHYIPIEDPQLVEWLEFEGERITYNDSVVTHFPTPFNSKFGIDAEGRYQLVRHPSKPFLTSKCIGTTTPGPILLTTATASSTSKVRLSPPTGTKAALISLISPSSGTFPVSPA